MRAGILRSGGDVWSADAAIGMDTALNTALEAIDRIGDTASSHQRTWSR
jgi:6-phosphofructokinase 1